MHRLTEGISSDLLMKSLSDDAKCILGGCFGVLGIPGKSKLTFGMKESRPTARAQSALDELVSAKAVSRSDLQGGSVEYLVQINCSDFGRWIRRNKSKGNWPITEPILARAALAQSDDDSRKMGE
jgi:hypothetical protein